jgi:hypothetical protein
VSVEEDDDHDAKELRPQHLFLKAQMRHEFSMSKIFDMENCRIRYF